MQVTLHGGPFNGHTMEVGGYRAEGMSIDSNRHWWRHVYKYRRPDTHMYIWATYDYDAECQERVLKLEAEGYKWDLVYGGMEPA